LFQAREFLANVLAAEEPITFNQVLDSDGRRHDGAVRGFLSGRGRRATSWGGAKDYSQFAPAMSAFEVIALRSLVRALQGMSFSNKKAGRALRDYSMRLLASHQFIKGNVRCLSAFYSGP
jgi:hypothetical protein